MNSEPETSHRRRRPGRRCDIQLQNPCRYPEAGARRLRPWLAPVVDDLAPGTDSLVVRFVSDREIRRLNASFRQRDEPTDVLSFPALPDLPALQGHPREPSSRGLAREPARSVAEGAATLAPGYQERHLGDVVISVPTARKQANRLGHSIDVELRILMLHGVLHCLGHDHETDGGVMDTLEQHLRRRYIGDV